MMVHYKNNQMSLKVKPTSLEMRGREGGRETREKLNYDSCYWACRFYSYRLSFEEVLILGCIKYYPMEDIPQRDDDALSPSLIKSFRDGKG